MDMTTTMLCYPPLFCYGFYLKVFLRLDVGEIKIQLIK